MALSEQIATLATTVGTDIKDILKNVGDLKQLTTSQKASLVAALNELKASINTITGKLNIIDDMTTTTSKTWSSTKINQSIETAVNGLINGAPETLDTLKELADAMTANKDAISALQSIATGFVKYDSAQSLNISQQKQARDNISAASKADLSATDNKAAKGVNDAANALAKANAADSHVGVLSTLKTTAKTSAVNAINEVKGTADSALAKANSVKSELDTFKLAVGDTNADFATTYTSARDGGLSA